MCSDVYGLTEKWVRIGTGEAYEPQEIWNLLELPVVAADFEIALEVCACGKSNFKACIFD